MISKLEQICKKIFGRMMMHEFPVWQLNAVKKVTFWMKTGGTLTPLYLPQISWPITRIMCSRDADRVDFGDSEIGTGVD